MLINIVGKKYFRLRVIKRVLGTNKNCSAFWKCICDCGNKKVIRGDSLKDGSIKSCGCYHSECARRIQNKYQYKHGLSKTKIFMTFQGIKKRCGNKKSKYYKNYGGRGIKCFWKTVEEFYRDMGNPPTKDHSIDRINNDGNYCKKNCRWATKKEQANNRRTCVKITYKGKTQNMKEWAKEIGIDNRLLWWRLNNGWPIAKALNNY